MYWIFFAVSTPFLFLKYIFSYTLGILILILIDLLQTEVPLIAGSTIDLIAAGGFKGSFISKTLINLALIAAAVFFGRIAWRCSIF